MKTEPAFHNRLRDAIRLCFPMVIRDRIEISPFTVWHDTEAPKTVVRIAFDEELPYYDHEALMHLLGAEEITGNRHAATIRGRYAGQECEIQLVTGPLLAC